MPTAAKQFQIDITTNPAAIIVTAEPIASNVPEATSVAQIINVQGIFFDFATVEANESSDQFKETYPFPTRTVLVITLNDGETTLKLELQSCTNQPTWNGGTLADLQQAVADITALIP